MHQGTTSSRLPIADCAPHGEIAQQTGTWLLLAISLAQALNCACAAVHLPHRAGDERHEERRKAEP